MKRRYFILALLVMFVYAGCLQNEEIHNGHLINTPLHVSDHVQRSDDSLQVVENIDVVDTLIDTVGNGKYIYITIDDCPMRGSWYIDSVIRDRKVKTSIFFVGSMIGGSKTFKKNYDQLSSNPYIESCNHSYMHANHKYSSYYKEPQKVLEDINLNEAELQLDNQIVRLPGRNTWQLGGRKKSENKETAEAAQLLVDNGYKVYGWDVEWGYEKEGKPTETVDELVEKIEEAYEKQRTFTKGHVIVLMHDQMFKTVYENRSLEELIDKLQENNYSFRYLKEYPEFKKSEIESDQSLIAKSF